jgi:hypothetical protein
MPYLGDGGPFYTPDNPSEYRTSPTWSPPPRRPLRPVMRWLVRAIVVALVVCGVHFGTNAKTPRVKPVPIGISAGMGGASVLGGRDVNRW